MTTKELQNILDTSDGIFENTMSPASFLSMDTSDSDDFTEIRDAFTTAEQNGKFTTESGERISFDIAPMSITRFRELVTSVATDKFGNPLSHLSISYGLSKDNKIVLIMRGVRFDDSLKGAKLKDLIPQQNMSEKQFTTSDLVARVRGGSSVGPRKTFKNAFDSIHNGNEFVKAAYMKFGPLLANLDKLEKDQCTHLNITFGFIDNGAVLKKRAELSCFHLIFTGLQEDNSTPSKKIFSTFQPGEEYSGPKPSCPPFGCPAEAN